MVKLPYSRGKMLRYGERENDHMDGFIPQRPTGDVQDAIGSKRGIETPKPDMDLIRSRLKQAKELASEQR